MVNLLYGKPTGNFMVIFSINFGWQTDNKIVVIFPLAIRRIFSASQPLGELSGSLCGNFMMMFSSFWMVF